MTDDGYARRAGVIAGSRGTVVAARLSAHRRRQQALRVTSRRQGHSTNLTGFILSGLLSTLPRRRMRRSRTKKCGRRAGVCQRRLMLACRLTWPGLRSSDASHPVCRLGDQCLSVFDGHWRRGRSSRPIPAQRVNPPRWCGLTLSGTPTPAWRSSIARTPLFVMPNTWMLVVASTVSAYAAAARSATTSM